MSRIRSLLLSLLALAAFATPARATWSIIIVDTRTGEIAIGCATCLTGFDLLTITPVLLVNRGAAAAQASVNIGSIQNRAVIWAGLMSLASPAEILSALAAQDPQHQTRQYGIVDVLGRKQTFSGTQNSQFAGGVTGSIGTIHYSIQGNILTGAAVVTAAEQAILTSTGDLPQRLMEAMEAARAMGGDGRCSCSPAAPTSCGAPPPSFTKSAHIGYMVVARQGDTDGTCTMAALGCASGDYYMKLNVANQTAAAPDPVLQLATQFDAWRTGLIGRPDHNLSTVTFDPPSLIPDGASTATATLVLRDRQGTPLASGGASVVVQADASGTAPVTIGAVTDNGDGTYTFPVTAATQVGTAQLRITADDGVRPVLLSPRTPIEVRADALWGATERLSAATGGSIPLQLDAGAGAAGRVYVVAMSGSGTTPGFVLPPALPIPLNPDPWFSISLQLANSPFFVNTLGSLDAQGRALAQFAMPGNNLLAPIIGLDFHFAYFLALPFDFASNAVRVTVVP